MKETTPKLTQTKKEEANKYIKYIYERTGIRFKCRKIKDFIFIKMLYLLLVDYEEMENDFEFDMMNNYSNPESWKDMEEYLYWGYNLYDIFPSYLVKYYYGDITNFANNWQYYDKLSKEEYEKKIDKAYKVFEKKANTENNKMLNLADNIGTTMIDINTFNEFRYLVSSLEYKGEEFYLEWRTERDERVCKYCAQYNGRRFLHLEDVPIRHPNCRCELVIVKDGELFTKYK